jgi:hypothetical protein
MVRGRPPARPLGDRMGLIWLDEVKSGSRGTRADRGVRPTGAGWTLRRPQSMQTVRS